MKGGWLLSLGNDGNGEERQVIRREREAPLLIYHLLLSSSQITSRRASGQPRSSPQMSDGAEQAPQDGEAAPLGGAGGQQSGGGRGGTGPGRG